MILYREFSNTGAPLKKNGGGRWGRKGGLQRKMNDDGNEWIIMVIYGAWWWTWWKRAESEERSPLRAASESSERQKQLDERSGSRQDQDFKGVCPSPKWAEIGDSVSLSHPKQNDIHRDVTSSANGCFFNWNYMTRLLSQSISNLISIALDALSFIDIIYNLSCSASMYVSVYAILHLIWFPRQQ